MKADAEHQPLVLVEHVVEARHALLDVDCGRHRGDRRVEFGQDGIACQVDHRAAAHFDGGSPDLVVDRLEVAHRPLLSAFHQTHEPGEIGMQDGGKPAAMGRHR
jgi:hypothetical protein